MTRKNLRLRRASRDAILETLEALTRTLEERGLHRDDASNVIEQVVSEVAEFGLEVVGLPDVAADALGDEAAKVVVAAGKRLVSAVRPDADTLIERAKHAAQAGKVKKAERLMDHAVRLMAGTA